MIKNEEKKYLFSTENEWAWVRFLFPNSKIAAFRTLQFTIF